MAKKEFTFSWKIENYFSCNVRHSEDLHSPRFTADSLFGTQWHLAFYPRGKCTSETYDCEDTENYFSCFLVRSHDDTSPIDKILVNFKIKILLPNGEIIVTTESDYEFPRSSQSGKIDLGDAGKLIKLLKKCNEDTLTVVCSIVQKENFSRKGIGCVATTKLGMDRCSHVWRVYTTDGSSVDSVKTFQFTDFHSIKVALTCPNDDILFRIKLIKTRNIRDSNVAVTCKIALLNGLGDEHDSRHEVMILWSGDEWEFPKFFSMSRLKNEKLILYNGYTERSWFHVALHFTMSNSQHFLSTQYQYEEHCSSFQNDFRDLLRYERVCDVQFRVQESVLPAHKSILSARSVVFAAMFESDVKENKTGVVDILDANPETFKKFLEYLYSDAFDDIECEMALNLLILGNKYQISSLEKKCSSFLMSSLSTDNACEVLSVADMVSDKILKKRAMSYIVGHSTELLCSNHWTDWLRCNLILGNEILLQISQKFENNAKSSVQKKIMYDYLLK